MSAPFLRTSERRDLMGCPQRWWWTWRMGLRSRSYTPNALWFGTGVHVALAAWYCGPDEKRGPEPAETWQRWAGNELRSMKVEFVDSLTEEIEAEYVDAIELGVTMLEGYRELYGRDEHKLIIQPEKTFRLSVPWPTDQPLFVEGEYDPNEPLLIYVGTYDSVWRDADTGQIWLDEHKTAASISTAHLALDPQAGSYWATAGRALRDQGLIGERETLAGIEYNFLRKGLPDERPRDAQGYCCNKPQKKHFVEQLTGVDGWTESELRKKKLEELESIAAGNMLLVLGERSKTQPAKLFLREKVHRTSAERRKQLERLQGEGVLAAGYRAGIIPLLKNPTRDCSFCPHQTLCVLDEQGGDTEEFISVAYRREDPYADHRQQ